MGARQRRLLVGITTAAVFVGALSTLVPALAATTIGAFEVDGDLVDSNTTDDIFDWDTLDQTDAVVVEFNDPTGQSDDSFGGGSKELEPSTWNFVSQSVPQKDDLLETGIATRQVDGSNWLYLYSQRKFAQGSAFIGYEFNSLNQTFDNDNNAATPEVPVRSNGDLLVLLIVENGGTSTSIDVFVWNGTHTSGVWEASDLAPTRGVDWEAVTENPGGTFLLSEAAIRLEAFGINPACPGLGQAWVHTTSSHKFENATLKDRTTRQNVSLSTCGSLTVHKIDDQGGDPLNGATFELRADSGPGDIPDGLFSETDDPQVGTCVTGEEGIDGQCTFEDVGPGTYWLREIQAPDGYAIVDASPTLVTVAPGENVTVGEAYVNHLLAPEFTVVKSVDPSTVDLSDGDTTNDTVTYTITVTNVGDGAGSTFVEDDYDQSHLTDITILTAGGTSNGDVIRWDDTGTIAPNGGTATFEYSGRIFGTFGADDPNDGCPGADQFPVINSVTVDGDSDSETVCVTAKPKFSVVKSADKAIAQIDEQVTYTLTVTNNGEAAGSTPVEDDYDQAHLTDITGIDPDSGVDDGDTITWADSGPIAAGGGSATFSYTGTITGPFDGTPGSGGCGEGQFPVVNTVQIDGDDTSNTVCVPASPEFSVVKESSTTSVDLMDGDTSNDVVTYTITVTNDGDAAGSTTVTDDYDQAHLANITGITPADGIDNGDTIVWDTGSIPAGESRQFSYQGTIVGGFTGPDGQGGCGEDEYPVINTVTIPDGEASVTVCVHAEPIFTVVKSANPTSVDLTDGDTSNDTVTYTLTVTNSGPAAGSTNVVDDYDEDHLTDIDNITPDFGVDDGFTITWLDAGPIAPNGGTAGFSYTARITGDFTGEPGGGGCGEGQFPVVNMVAVDGDDDSATVCVTAAPDFSVVKTANPTTVDLSDGDTSNDTVTYTITVTNSGAAAGSTPVEDDYDQDHLTDIADITPADGVDDGDRITWQSDVIAPNGGMAEFSYTARIAGDFTGEPGGEGCEPHEFPVLNAVTVDGDDDGSTVCVTAVPAFEVVKSADPSSVDLSDGDTSNDVVTYTITVTNNGAASGSTPVDDDYDQEHLVDIADITPADGTDDGDVITWTSGVIAPNGGTAEFSYTGRIVGPFASDETNAEQCDGAGEFPVINIVTVDGDETSEVVCAQTGPAFEAEKSASPTTVDLSDGDTSNDTVTYTITVTNTGSGPGTTLVEDDYDQDHLTDIADIDPADGVDDGDRITWTSGAIESGASATFSYTGRVVGPFTSDEANPDQCAGDNEFPVVNQVAISGGGASAIVCVNAEPVFVPVKTADRSTAQIGEDVTYTITVTNQGQGPGSTSVEDDYDQDHLLVDDTTIDPASGVNDGDTITWADSGTIEPGAEAIFSYTGEIIGTFSGPSGGGECDDGSFPVLNTVTVDGDTASSTVCVPADPQFTIIKSAAPTSVDLSDGDTTNDTVTYTLTVENIGEAEGVATVVDDFDEAHLTDIDAGGGTISEDGTTITFVTDTMQPGETRTFTYSGRVFGPFTSDEAGPGCEGETEFPVINLVEVLGPDGVADDSATATVCANAEPRFVFVKTAEPTSIDLADGDDTNDSVTYTIVATNIGEGPGSTEVVDDYDQDHFAPTGSNPEGADNGDTVTWQSGTIEPGDDAVFTLTGTVFGSFTLDDSGSECEGQDEFVLENLVVGTDARAVVCVHAPPGLDVEKLARNLTDDGEFADTATGVPGDQIEYQIVVTNTGSSTATGVVASDAVPEGMSFVSCEPALSCSETGGVVTWNVGTLEAGADSGPLTMIVQIGDQFEPGFTLVGNIAVATRDGGDEPTQSNPVTVTVTVVTKAVCTTNPTPGAAIEYTIPYGAHGGDVHGVVLEDQLPEHVLFESASPEPTSAPNPGETGTVRWEFGTLTDGTSATATIRGRISLEAVEGELLENVVTLSADGVPPASFTQVTTVIEDGEATANAQGLYINLLGNEIGPMPDSDEANPDSLLDFQDPISGEVAQVKLLEVSEGESVDGSNASAHAIATAADVKLVDTLAGPGEEWLVTATAVRAVSSSNADLATAGSSSAGSKLVGVTVLGQNLGTVTEPTTVEVILPGGLLTARVELLEHIRTGAADGVVQPDAGVFQSGITVNGIHVVVTNSSGDVVTEVIVSHAVSDAAFLSGLACGEELPRVSGTGYALSVTADETLLDPDNTLVYGEAARVQIPITGGEDSSTQAHVGPLSVEGNHIIESNAAFAHSVGVIDRDAGSAVADTEAQIEALRLLEHSDAPGETDLLLSADLIRTEVHAEATDAETASATGSTTLVDLEIEGTDVCEMLGLQSACTPEANTTIEVGGAVLVILNEQIEGPSGPGVASLTVNAIHIFVIGQDNPFGLPVGVEIIVSSSHAGAHAEGGMVAEDDGDTEALLLPAEPASSDGPARPTVPVKPVPEAVKPTVPTIAPPEDTVEDDGSSDGLLGGFLSLF
ncbi:MAG TPA: choice-of-anchor P family protein [Actinomycetota bacterium]